MSGYLELCIIASLYNKCMCKTSKNSFPGENEEKKQQETCLRVDVYIPVETFEAPRPRDPSTSVVVSDLVALSTLSDHSNFFALSLSHHISSLLSSIKSSILSLRPSLTPLYRQNGHRTLVRRHQPAFSPPGCLPAIDVWPCCLAGWYLPAILDRS